MDLFCAISNVLKRVALECFLGGIFFFQLPEFIMCQTGCWVILNLSKEPIYFLTSQTQKSPTAKFEYLFFILKIYTLKSNHLIESYPWLSIDWP